MKASIRVTYTETVIHEIEFPKNCTYKQRDRIIQNVVESRLDWDDYDYVWEGPEPKWSPEPVTFPDPEWPGWATLSDGSRWAASRAMVLREGSALPTAWASRELSPHLAEEGGDWVAVSPAWVERLIEQLEPMDGEDFRFDPVFAPVLRQGIVKTCTRTEPFAHGVYSEAGELLAVVTPLDPRGNDATQTVNSRGEVSSV